MVRQTTNIGRYRRCDSHFSLNQIFGVTSAQASLPLIATSKNYKITIDTKFENALAVDAAIPLVFVKPFRSFGMCLEQYWIKIHNSKLKSKQ
jgi:hypothetical protein